MIRSNIYRLYFIDIFKIPKSMKLVPWIFVVPRSVTGYFFVDSTLYHHSSFSAMWSAPSPIFNILLSVKKFGSRCPTPPKLSMGIILTYDCFIFCFQDDRKLGKRMQCMHLLIKITTNRIFGWRIWGIGTRVVCHTFGVRSSTHRLFFEWKNTSFIWRWTVGICSTFGIMRRAPSGNGYILTIELGRKPYMKVAIEYKNS